MRLPFLELSGTCLKQGQVHGESLKDLIEKDRKSVVQGKSVDLGGRRIIKKKNQKKKTNKKKKTTK